MRVEWSPQSHQRLPGVQLLWRQELALLTPLLCILYSLCCGLYGDSSLLRAVRLDMKRRCEVRCRIMCTNALSTRGTVQCRYDHCCSIQLPAMVTLLTEAEAWRQPQGEHPLTSSMPWVAA